MEIGSGKGYPGAALSNFAPHPFVFAAFAVHPWRDCCSR